jgi:hypothetical protein
MRIGRTVLAAASAIMLASIGMAHAQTNVPGAKGLDSVDKNLDKNLAKNPDNRGLENAQDRIQRNEQRRALDKAAKTKHAEKAEKVDKVEKVAKADRPERPAHPDRPGR